MKIEVGGAGEEGGFGGFTATLAAGGGDCVESDDSGVGSGRERSSLLGWIKMWVQGGDRFA